MKGRKERRSELIGGQDFNYIEISAVKFSLGPEGKDLVNNAGRVWVIQTLWIKSVHKELGKADTVSRDGRWEHCPQQRREKLKLSAWSKGEGGNDLMKIKRTRAWWRLADPCTCLLCIRTFFQMLTFCWPMVVLDHYETVVCRPPKATPT